MKNRKAAVSLLLLLTGLAITTPMATTFLHKQMLIKNLQLRPFGINDPVPACGKWRSTMPKHRDPAAYQKYISARKFWRSKRPWNFTREENQKLLSDVSEAAAKGDWGARLLLLHFYKRGLGSLEKNLVLNPAPEEAMKIINSGIENGHAWAFHELGIAYESGYSDLEPDEEIAKKLYLRAAELGSPEAQMILAEYYLAAMRFDAVEHMQQCAFAQKHGDAARQLAVHRKARDDYSGFLRYSQEGVKFGNEESASALMLIFSKEVLGRKTREQQTLLKELGILPDAERKERYKEIGDALDLNPDLRLDRLDKVLPLPPAPLPEWNGVADALEPESDKVPAY
jgi:hypothetical protein